MTLIAKFSDEAGSGSVYLKRNDLGQYLVYLDGKFHKSLGMLTDDQALDHTTRCLGWGAYGTHRTHYTMCDACTCTLCRAS